MDIEERFYNLIELTVLSASLTNVNVPMGSRYAVFFKFLLKKGRLTVAREDNTTKERQFVSFGAFTLQLHSKYRKKQVQIFQIVRQIQSQSVARSAIDR